MKNGWQKQNRMGQFKNCRDFHICTNCQCLTSHRSQLCDKCFMEDDMELSGKSPRLGAIRSTGMNQIEERL